VDKAAKHKEYSNASKQSPYAKTSASNYYYAIPIKRTFTNGNADIKNAKRTIKKFPVKKSSRDTLKIKNHKICVTHIASFRKMNFEDFRSERKSYYV